MFVLLLHVVAIMTRENDLVHVHKKSQASGPARLAAGTREDEGGRRGQVDPATPLPSHHVPLARACARVRAPLANSSCLAHSSSGSLRPLLT